MSDLAKKVSLIAILILLTVFLKNAPLNHPTVAAPTEVAQLSDQLVKEGDSHSSIIKAEKRKQLMLDLAKNNPKEFLLNALPANATKNFDPEVKENTEKEVNLKGKMYVRVWDDFDHKKAGKEITFVDSKTNKKYDVNSSGNLNVPSGSTVGLKGYSLDQNLVLSAQSVGSLTVYDDNSQSPLGNQNVLVLLVNFQNDTSQPLSATDANKMVFTSATSSAAFTKESSYGLTTYQGQVVGYYTLPYSNAGCDVSTFANDADNLARNGGVDVDSYSRRLYLGNFANCPWSGLSEVGNNPSHSWVDISSPQKLDIAFVYHLTHELGHSLGLDHASSLDCNLTFSATGSEEDPNCTQDEYGDLTDIMGGGFNYQFNGPHKYELGYLSSSQVVTVNSTGTYDISRLEDEAAGIKLVRIPIPASASYYYLSYRQPVGKFDKFISSIYTSGASLTMKNDPSPYNSLVDNSFALDAKTSTIGQYDSMIDNQTISDQFGTTIHQVSHTGNSVKLNITINKTGCYRGVPDVSIDPASQATTSGGVLNYTLTVKNNDSATCSPSTFHTDTLDYSNDVSANSQSLTVAPGATGVATISVSSVPTAGEGIYLMSTQFTGPSPRHNLVIKFNYIITSDGSMPELTATPTPLPTIPPFTPTPTPTPTIKNIEPTDDATVTSAGPNQNFGTLTTLTANDANPEKIIYMKYVIPALTGKTILSANLHLRVIQASQVSTQQLKFSPDNSYTELSLVYNNRPAFTSTLQSFTNPTANTYKDLNVLNFVKNHLGSTVTLGITTDTEQVSYASKENANPDYAPELIITYQ